MGQLTYQPISWKRLMVTRPERAFEFKLLALIDQYVTNQDPVILEGVRQNIDICVDVIARCSRYGDLVAKADKHYVDLKCKEITLAGYCLSVQRSPLDPHHSDFLYKIYHHHNGRDIVTSNWV